MSSSDLAGKLIDYVNRPGYRPQRAKSLAKNLGVTKKRMDDFRSVLDDLIQQGRLRLSEGGRIQSPVPADAILGTIRKISSGAAYLIPHEPKPHGIDGDIFIEAADLKDAHNGDEVLVRLLRRRRSGGKRCGAVIDVLERSTNIFVGTYFEEDETGWVEIDGHNFLDPIWVGDPGAKGAQPGDKVVIEMLRFPTHRHVGEAVLTKVLGARGEPGVDTQLIIHEFGLPHEFPVDALEEARLEAENFDETDFEGREDLTGELIITIDPADARDFDDAISLNRDERGHWHLGVHIADVSHFVTPGSALDREARLRGTSVYLPTLVIPMLPEVISNGLASLQEKRTRLTKSIFIEFTPEGIPVHSRFANTVIRTARRFAYEQVLPIVQNPADHHGKVPGKIRKVLVEMHELAMILRRRRIANGYLELDMPEIKLEFDRDQRVIGAHETVHDESHQMIEEFMLAANIAVARQLTDRGIPFLRRVHGEPSPVKLKQLQEFVTSLGYRFDQPLSRRAQQQLLADAKGQPEDRAINFALLRSMKRAEYSALPNEHYALAEEHYCHFTSPIRRYPDLTIHRIIEGLLTGNPVQSAPSGEELLQLGHHCSGTERRAADAERELTHLKLLHYMKTRIGEEFDAVITGVDRYGFFARGQEFPVEGLVHISTLSDHEYFNFDRESQSLVGWSTGRRFRLGDQVRVAATAVDVDRRSLDLKLIQWLGGTRKKKPQPGKSRRGQSKRDADQTGTGTSSGRTGGKKRSAAKQNRTRKKPSPGSKKGRRPSGQ